MNEWLPPLILLNDYNGSWDPYLAAVYAQFHKDFVESKPMFREVRLGLKSYPIEQEKESTFGTSCRRGRLRPTVFLTLEDARGWAGHVRLLNKRQSATFQCGINREKGRRA